MAIAAESMDLGICYIGGIRNDLDTVAQRLSLPELTVPLFRINDWRTRNVKWCETTDAF